MIRVLFTGIAAQCSRSALSSIIKLPSNASHTNSATRHGINHFASQVACMFSCLSFQSKIHFYTFL